MGYVVRWNMRQLALVLGCVAVVELAAVQPSSAHPHRGAAVTFSVFYDGLSPYGEWIAISGGVYGWRPIGIAVGWRPYTIGRWVWTDYGWYWVSDEPWGWAVFHYGRWYYDDFYGWIWIPGYDWAPAWVEWRYGGDYIGWAPLGPYAVFSIHWGIHYRTRWYTPVHWWSFVHCRYVSTPHIYRYVERPEWNTRYIGVTRSGGSVRYRGGRIVSRGPEPDYIERRGNVRLAPIRVREVDDQPVERIVRDGTREHIEVYRPRITEWADDEAANVRPARLREDAGRSLYLDTRKLDLRVRESTQPEIREPRRTDEDRSRDGGMLKGPVDDAIRSREGRRQESEVRVTPESRHEEPPQLEPRRSRDESVRQREAFPERQAVPQRDGRDRKREESYQRAQRDDARYSFPQRSARQPSMNVPQRQSEPRRNDASPQRNPSRDSGGRSGRGR